MITLMPESVWKWSCLSEDSRTLAGSQVKSLSRTQTLEPLRRLMVNKNEWLKSETLSLERERELLEREREKGRKQNREWELRIEEVCLELWMKFGVPALVNSNRYNYEPKNEETARYIYIVFDTSLTYLGISVGRVWSVSDPKKSYYMKLNIHFQGPIPTIYCIGLNGFG
jgi:hypothetical protein